MLHRAKFSFRIASIVALLLAAVWYMTVCLPPWPHEARSALTNGTNLALGLLAAISLGFASWFTRGSKRLSVAWLLVSLSFFADATGNVIWMVFENILGLDPYPSIADIAYLAFYPLCVIGLLLIPTVQRSFIEHVKEFLDLGVVAVASALLYWIFLISPLFVNNTTNSWLDLGVTLAYPAFDLVVIWCAGLLVIRQQSGRALVIFILSALSIAIADSVLNYEIVSATYVSGSSSSDVFYVAAYLLAFLSGVAQVCAAQGTELLAGTNPARAANRSSAPARLADRPLIVQVAAFLLPYIWVAVAFWLLIREQVQLRTLVESTYIFEVTLSIGVILSLVLVRQILTIVEKQTLSSHLTRLLKSSEQMTTSPHTLDLTTVIVMQLKGLTHSNCALLLMPENGDQCMQVLLDDSNVVDVKVVPYSEDIRKTLEGFRKHPSDTNYARSTFDPVASRLERDSATPHTKMVWTAVPLTIKDKIIGVIASANHTPLSWQQTEVMVLFAHQASAMIANTQLRKQEAVAAATQAAVYERSRLARELHDSVSQALFGMFMGTVTARELLPPEMVRVKDALDYVTRLSEGALAEMRALIFELRPESLEQEGLLRALQRQTEFLCRRHTLDAHIQALSEPDVPMEVKEALYRIAIEAVQNSIKHARASRVDISLATDDSPRKSTVLEIKDNGQGFDTEKRIQGHLGLVSMRERAEQLGGVLHVTSTIGTGTLVRVIIPALSEAGTPLSAVV